MNFNIIYNKYTGEIDRAISSDQDYKIFYSYFPNEFIDSLNSIYYEGFPPTPLNHYYIDIGTLELKQYSQKIMDEKDIYGIVLSEEERLNILLQPSYEEVAKAESTLEILSTLQEVGLI